MIVNEVGVEGDEKGWRGEGRNDEVEEETERSGVVQQ